MPQSGLEIRKACPELEPVLSALFDALRDTDDARRFHPHPFTPAEAHRVANYVGKDLYYVLMDSPSPLGYAMLRGWDAGFEVPSLGVCLLPPARGRGLGELLMQFLHAAARERGAAHIRLKVYPDNVSAIRLYERLGYIFQDKQEDEQRVAYLDL